ncbi:MAG: restriction endonuclease [Alphaproteobacteria bacterium]|nr:restriction endonuclease [Alphaproteobacteria bacterium]
MGNVWCVRADFGTYAKQFVDGGYVAIGWRLADTDLSSINNRDQINALYRADNPEETSNIVIGQQVGQIARFLCEMQAGDYVITPDKDTEWLHYGKIAEDPSYYYQPNDEACPYPHRRRVEWGKERLKRADFSVPFQNTMRSSLTVFAVSQKDEFLTAIGRKDLVAPTVAHTIYDPYRVVLEQVLELNDKEFEFLTKHLLAALGFEGSQVTGKSGDGGVDATGELDVSNLAKIKIFVQAKRYKLGAKVSASTVRQLRQAIPFGGQGAFITTADFQEAATDVALEAGFPRIGLINGRQLVDLLIEHWPDIPEDFRNKLGLKPGLVRA